MKTGFEYLDEIQDELRELSIEQWLEFLEELRDELDMKIDAVKGDIKRKQE